MTPEEMKILVEDYETYVEEPVPADPFVALQHCLTKLQEWRSLYIEEGEC